jgi:large subunit ribosomal protein L4
MQVSTYTQNGKESGKAELPSEIFDVKMNSDLVHQVVLAQMSNQRQVIAHTKDKSEVRGGGRKPWKQKGTGRARHGSIRSPIWKGGGVTFGPTKDRNFKKKINKKMRRKALFMVLSSKVGDKEMIILDELKIEKPKTKEVVKIIQTPVFAFFSDKSTTDKSKVESRKSKVKNQSSILVALSKKDVDITRAAKNIQKVKIVQAKDLNVLDLLNYKYLMMPREGIETIKTTFLKNVK